MNQKDCNSHQYCTETTGIGSVLSNYVLSQNWIALINTRPQIVASLNFLTDSIPSKKHYIKYSMRDITSCKLNFDKSNTAPLYREIGYYPVLSKNRIQTTFYREIEYRPDESRNRIQTWFIEKSNTDLFYREIDTTLMSRENAIEQFPFYSTINTI